MAKKQNPDLKVKTQEFRVSHPHLHEPTQFKDKQGRASGEPSYSVQMLFPKDTTDLKILQKALHAAKVEKWGTDKNKWPTPLNQPIKDGDKPFGREREVKPEYEGHWIVSATSSAKFRAPEVIDESGKPVSKNDFFGGCWACAALTAAAYDTGSNVGVKFYVEAVQKIETPEGRDDSPFGNRRPASEIFGVRAASDDAESFNDDDMETEESFL